MLMVYYAEFGLFCYRRSDNSNNNNDDDDDDDYNNNNNIHLSCAHQRPERSHDIY